MSTEEAISQNINDLEQLTLLDSIFFYINWVVSQEKMFMKIAIGIDLTKVNLEFFINSTS